jgi:hypothetical protein
VYKLEFGPKAFIVVSDPVVVRYLLKVRRQPRLEAVASFCCFQAVMLETDFELGTLFLCCRVRPSGGALPAQGEPAAATICACWAVLSDAGYNVGTA